MEQVLGEIRLWSGSLTPKNWMLCHGQELPIFSFQALYSVLGTTFGGDGKHTFKLPDLRGRTPVSTGANAGEKEFSLGEYYGQEGVSLTEAEMPKHTHTMYVSDSESTISTPKGAAFGVGANNGYRPSNAQNDVTLGAESVSTAGVGDIHNNMMPSLGLNFIIATEGTYPPRPPEGDS
ncbi:MULTISPECIES: phage tail protein [Gammaproteobacteria]|uniref:phage tail protein n=1 Tax=Gammaproteobacteria TaxID=1236 RepID=UPI000DCFDC81|nr:MULTISPECIES: tail fiber protein [Gammaproteobacteria]RTE86080.1 phage tail protein [Aliidiomarina sp. B3213]TCZ91434.1 phage tail protein [Lysobacter sp. N42]